MSTTTATIYEEIQKLREAGDPDATKRLVQIMQEDPHAAVRAEAAKAIGTIHNMDSARPLVKLLQSPNPQVRMLAAEALGELDSEAGVEALIGTLKDENEVVRANSAASLGKLGDERGIPALVEALNDDSLETQFAAAGSLADIGQPAVVEPLIAWSERVFAAPIKEFNAHQKATMIHAIMVNLLEQLDDEHIYLLTSHIGQAVEIKTWGILHTGARDAQCWLQETVDSPIGRAVKEELALRKAESGARGAPPESPEENGHDANGTVRETPTVDMILDDFARQQEGMISETEGLAAAQPTPDIPPPQLTPDMRAALAETVVVRNPEWAAGQPAPEAAADAPGAAAEPESEEEAPEEETVEYPSPEPLGVVAEFLAMLDANNLEGLVLIGGAVRDMVLMRDPSDLDVAVELLPTPEMWANDEDPIAWNEQFAAAAAPLIEGLAKALNVSVEELIEGKAKFVSESAEPIPVHYVGPYLLEETETTFSRRRVGRVRRQRVSRYGLVVDTRTKRIKGLVPVSTIDALALDRAGRAVGDLRRGLHHLHERIFHFDSPSRRPSIGDILHAMAAKRSLQAEITRTAAAALFVAAETLAKSPEEAKDEFSAEDYARLAAAVAGPEQIVEDLDLLGINALVAPWLEDSLRSEIEEINARRAGEADSKLAGVKEEFEAGEADLQAKIADSEAKNAAFAESAGSLDAARAEGDELQARRRERLDRLAEGEKNAEAAAKALDAATARLRETSATGKADVAVIREHREALASQRTIEAELARIKDEVKETETELEANRARTLELQAGLESLGQELESAVVARDEAQTRRDAALAALEAMQAEINLTRDLRIERFRQRPAPAA